MKLVRIVFSLIVLLMFSASCVSNIETTQPQGDDEASSGCENFTADAVCSDTLLELSPTGIAPEARFLAGVAYDSASDSLILFGGTDGTNYFKDVFVLANASGTATPAWSELSTSGTSPSTGLADAFVAYNADANKLIVFGGNDGDDIKSSLYLLTHANGLGGDAAWSRAEIDGARQLVRGQFAGAYDEVNDRIILFGGRACSGETCTLFNDVYFINDVTTDPAWAAVTTSGIAPTARADATAVYDSTNDRLIIFGGFTGTTATGYFDTAVDEVWVLANVSGAGGAIPAWSQLAPTSSAGKLFAHSAVYDSTRDRMIIFGGMDEAGVAQGDVYVLAGSSGGSPVWITHNPCSVLPDARSYHSAVYSGSSTDVMFVFGGLAGGGTALGDIFLISNASGNPSSEASTLSIEAASAEICVGNTLQLVPKLYDAESSALQNFLYYCTSSDAAVATVDAYCNLTGVLAGSATIDVWAGGLEKSLLVP